LLRLTSRNYVAGGGRVELAISGKAKGVSTKQYIPRAAKFDRHGRAMSTVASHDPQMVTRYLPTPLLAEDDLERELIAAEQEHDRAHRLCVVPIEDDGRGKRDGYFIENDRADVKAVLRAHFAVDTLRFVRDGKLWRKCTHISRPAPKDGKILFDGVEVTVGDRFLESEKPRKYPPNAEQMFAAYKNGTLDALIDETPKYDHLNVFRDGGHADAAAREDEKLAQRETVQMACEDETDIANMLYKDESDISVTSSGDDILVAEEEVKREDKDKEEVNEDELQAALNVVYKAAPRDVNAMRASSDWRQRTKAHVKGMRDYLLKVWPNYEHEHEPHPNPVIERLKYDVWRGEYVLSVIEAAKKVMVNTDAQKRVRMSEDFDAMMQFFRFTDLYFSFPERPLLWCKSKNNPDELGWGFYERDVNIDGREPGESDRKYAYRQLYAFAGRYSDDVRRFGVVHKSVDVNMTNSDGEAALQDFDRLLPVSIDGKILPSFRKVEGADGESELVPRLYKRDKDVWADEMTRGEQLERDRLLRDQNKRWSNERRKLPHLKGSKAFDKDSIKFMDYKLVRARKGHEVTNEEVGKHFGKPAQNVQKAVLRIKQHYNKSED
jgi:hypothetical protein